jgi:hypothetical protein
VPEKDGAVIQGPNRVFGRWRVDHRR